MSFLAIQIAIGQQNIREQEMNIVLSEAMSATQITMREQIEDRLYSTNNALCHVDGSCFMSEQDYVDYLIRNIQKSVSTNSKYSLIVYSADIEKGLLDVELLCKYRILGKEKTLSNRKTSIVEIIGKVEE